MADDEEFFTRLTELLGTPPMGADERAAVLDLTRIVAHGSERRFAPLTAYALALTLDERMPSAERASRVRSAMTSLQSTIADDR